jgi:hypothetical protein
MINRIDAVLPHLATKEELADLRGVTKQELADLRGEMRTGFADLRGEMRTALAGKPSHAYLWGVMGAMVGGQAVSWRRRIGAGDPPGAAASGSDSSTARERPSGRHRVRRRQLRLDRDSNE